MHDLKIGSGSACRLSFGMTVYLLFLAGHGGARAAEYVKRHLFSNLITHPKFISDTKSAISTLPQEPEQTFFFNTMYLSMLRSNWPDAYNHTDSELLKSENSHNRDAGSTASTAILIGDRLIVANVGDSRAVISRGGNAIAVSRDHKPDQSDERERIENAGGFVMWAGTWRVGGILAVSRAFGDRLLKQYVEAVAMVKEVEDPEESAKKLVGEAIKRGSADNITCVIVRFLETASSSHPSSSSSNEANLMPQVGELKISSSESKQDQVDSEDIIRVNKPDNAHF
ncbi:hypothetical protein YC2023_021055 [Brassica napus]